MDGEMKSSRRVLLRTLLVFLLAIFSRQLIFAVPGYRTLYTALPEILQWLEQPVRWIAICLLGLYAATHVRPNRAAAELGLRASPEDAGQGCFAPVLLLINIQLLLC